MEGLFATGGGKNRHDGKERSRRENGYGGQRVFVAVDQRREERLRVGKRRDGDRGYGRDCGCGGRRDET